MLILIAWLLVEKNLIFCASLVVGASSSGQPLPNRRSGKKKTARALVEKYGKAATAGMCKLLPKALQFLVLNSSNSPRRLMAVNMDTANSTQSYKLLSGGGMDGNAIIKLRLCRTHLNSNAESLHDFV